MTIKRREFISLSAIGAIGIAGMNAYTSDARTNDKTSAKNNLERIAGDVVPIREEERKDGIEKAQRLLIDQNMQALMLDAGTSMQYFTGIVWWPSERPMIAIIPAKGEP